MLVCQIEVNPKKQMGISICKRTDPIFSIKISIKLARLNFGLLL